MNERIQELWDQAAHATAAFPSGQNNSWETQVNFMEKFAELIVRECASYPDIDDGKPFKAYFTSNGSQVAIEFPWAKPESPEYVFVPNERFPNEVLTEVN